MELRQYTKPYHTAHTIVYSCHYHVICCPTYRRTVLTDTVAAHMKELVLAKQADDGYTVIEMDVLPNHVHLLLDVDPRAGINGIVGKMKGFTSHKLRNEFPWLKKRVPTLWTRRTFISTVGAVTRDVVQQSIENQTGV